MNFSLCAIEKGLLIKHFDYNLFTVIFVYSQIYAYKFCIVNDSNIQVVTVWPYVLIHAENNERITIRPSSLLYQRFFHMVVILSLRSSAPHAESRRAPNEGARSIPYKQCVPLCVK